MALCNMSTEMGAKATYIHPDAVTLDFLKSRASAAYTPVSTDADFAYAEDLRFDVSSLKPQVAAPSSVDNVFDLDEYVGTPISQAYIGSCTGGRLEDIAVAASILKGKKIASGTRLLVVPASRQTLLDAVRDGHLQALIHAGATFVTPSCAACLGTHQGLLADGETCISSTNRNFPGRMGSTGAEIYLGSPASVAAAALEGKITNPLKYL